jgi:hypothetical protein
VALRNLGGARLFSLAELMYEYKVGDLALMLSALTSARQHLATSDKLGQPICTDEFCTNLSQMLEGLVILCENFDADPSLIGQIQTLSSELKIGEADRREAVLRARVDAIGEAIENNLNSRKFMYIPVDQASYWNNLKMFGEHFVLAFPEKATMEMLEAGKCLAAARGTACVFHCMRVAEYGLRKLAQKLNVTISDKNKKCPLEYGDWNKVITEIRGAITETRKLPNGPRKEAKLQFYSNAADHCEYMKDIWRNEVMHARRFYNEAETKAVVNRVRDFVSLFKMSKKHATKELNKRLRRIQQFQRAHGELDESSAQRD